MESIHSNDKTDYIDNQSSNDSIEIVINNCYGLFSLSEEGYRRYHELLKHAGLLDKKLDPSDDLEFYNDPDNWHLDLFNIGSNYQLRKDPLLIQAIKELGRRASPSSLDIVTIKKGTKYIIEEHDGWETIRTIDSFRWATA